MAKSRIHYEGPVRDILDEDVTHIRLYKEDGGWILDGADNEGNYSSVAWRYNSHEDAVNDLEAFRATFDHLN